MLQEAGVLSYSGYSLSKGHSMAMRCSLNSGLGSRTVVIKLLMIYGPELGPFCFQNCSFGTGCVCLKIWDLSVMIVWCVTTGYGLTC